MAIPSDEAPTNEGKPPMPEKPLWDARDAIIALSTSSRLRKLCTYETGGKSGTRVKSMIRHPKFGVRGSKFRKPLALEEVGAEAGSIFLADHEQEQLIFQYSIGDKPVPRDTVIAWGKGISGAVFQLRRGPDYQPGRPGCDPPSLHRSDDGFCHAGQGG